MWGGFNAGRMGSKSETRHLLGYILNPFAWRVTREQLRSNHENKVAGGSVGDRAGGSGILVFRRAEYGVYQDIGGAY
ncbi:MAG: hypothetical protein JWQ71_4632 [Pedosphaera sp.]|nr:hypothetical protein [Pedosphaera sp.]